MRPGTPVFEKAKPEEEKNQLRRSYILNKIDEFKEFSPTSDDKAKLVGPEELKFVETLKELRAKEAVIDTRMSQSKSSALDNSYERKGAVSGRSKTDTQLT